jgi:hypothetical protein
VSRFERLRHRGQGSPPRWLRPPRIGSIYDHAIYTMHTI